MRKFSRLTGIILILIMAMGLTAGTVSAKTWTFGTTGQSQNPFTPRGYLVDTEKGQHWLSSPFNNTGTEVKYSGVENGVDYLDAKKSDGSNYTFYAMTDRNPSPKDTSSLGYGKAFIFAYKDEQPIPNFQQYAKIPAVQADKVDPSGHGTCYAFKIEGFELEPGSIYEFGFLRGMQANNGITLVLAEDEEGNTTGYIQEKGDPLTSVEKKRYESEKNKEYEFISSWHKKANGKGYTVNKVPMRFKVQTYADLTYWEKEDDKAQEFIDSVTDKDLKEGKYKRSNIKQLKLILARLNKEAQEEVKTMTQGPANQKMKEMAKNLNTMLKKAQSQRAEPADISKLKAKLKAAEKLYAKTSANVGISEGQYGRIEVEDLGEEIERAKKMDKFTPQNEIDDEMEALEYAMIQVKASLIEKDMIPFYDKVTGIYVLAPADSLPENAKLFVRRMGKETSDYKSIEKNLSEHETEAIFYNIHFYQGDRKIQPTKSVQVEMPIDDNISQKSSNVYSVGKKGSLNKINSVKANGTQCFKQKTLDALVLAGSTATDAEKAEARGQRMHALMAQKKDKDADNKNNQLEKDKKKKEEYKDPINKILKRNMNTATFSNDVEKETNPIYLILAAVLLAIVAVSVGIRALLQQRHEKMEK